MHQEEPGGTAKVATRSWDTPSKERAPGSYRGAGPYLLALLLAPIHPSAWKKDSATFACRILHKSPC